MTDITIYHNPNCSTSRKVLALLRERGLAPEVVEYLRNPPTRDELIALAAQMGTSVRGLLRRKGTPYDELGLDDAQWSDEDLLGFIAQHPILIERPVVVTPLGARLCRPVEKVLEILPA